MQLYDDVRQCSLVLVEGLSAEDMQLQSMPDASPLKWHLAHTSWFFETFFLKPHPVKYKVFDPQFEYLFNSYYDAVGARHPRPMRGLLSRPSLTKIIQYRQHVDEAVRQRWHELSTEQEGILTIGLHHEMQHQELMVTDFKHALWQNQYALPHLSAPDSPGSQSGQTHWVHFAAGPGHLGHDMQQGFAYDCESPRHKVQLPSYALGQYPVNNRDWLQFINDHGYKRPELWLSEGFDQAQRNNWHAPLYWDLQDFQQSGDINDIRVMTWHGHRELDLDEPVCHISFYEADAFARWAGARLPSEAEWENAANKQALSGNFLNTDICHPRPVEKIEDKSETLAALFGDVWEWTQSAYSPYPGFRPAQGALGEYNGKFMVNQYVLRGGSCASSKEHIRSTYRNFFHPHQRWQFSGLRLAKDI